jgi:hypothetical protein
MPDPLSAPFTSINGYDPSMPLVSPKVDKHGEFLSYGGIMDGCEESFRPASDEIDLVALKQVMGKAFKEEMVSVVQERMSKAS